MFVGGLPVPIECGGVCDWQGDIECAGGAVLTLSDEYFRYQQASSGSLLVPEVQQESGFCCRVVVDLTRAVDPGARRWFNYRVQGAKGTELQMDIVNAGDTPTALAVGERRGCGINVL